MRLLGVGFLRSYILTILPTLYRKLYHTTALSGHCPPSNTCSGGGLLPSYISYNLSYLIYEVLGHTDAHSVTGGGHFDSYLKRGGTLRFIGDISFIQGGRICFRAEQFSANFVNAFSRGQKKKKQLKTYYIREKPPNWHKSEIKRAPPPIENK